MVDWIWPFGFQKATPSHIKSKKNLNILYSYKAFAAITFFIYIKSLFYFILKIFNSLIFWEIGVISTYEC